MEKNPEVSIDGSDSDEHELNEEELKRIHEASRLTTTKDNFGRRRAFSGCAGEVPPHK